MEAQEQIKEMVRQKYTEIALQDKGSNEASCCGSGCCSTDVYNIMTDDYTNLKGYNPDADLGLGCGLPTQFAKIKKGDVLCVIEAMKLFNEIESEVSGRIIKVIADDSSPVEYDQPLFLVEPI